MAPIGGGPPVSSSNSFTGAAQALETTGNHVYAYSGAFEASTSAQTMFSFTSPGSGYIVATITMTGPVDMSAAGVVNGKIRGYQLDFNGQTVGLYKADSAQEDMPTVIEAQILIPPFTAVVLTCVDNDADASQMGTANITGRVHGAE